MQLGALIRQLQAVLMDVASEYGESIVLLYRDDTADYFANATSVCLGVYYYQHTQASIVGQLTPYEIKHPKTKSTILKLIPVG